MKVNTHDELACSVATVTSLNLNNSIEKKENGFMNGHTWIVGKGGLWVKADCG